MNRKCALKAGLLVLLLVAGAGLVGGCLFMGGAKAVIEVSATSGVVPLTIEYDGSGSSGPGDISTYTWDFDAGGQAVYTDEGSYTYEKAGTYTLSLTVRAEDGSTDTQTVTITVEPALWYTDENLGRIYKLDMQGNQLLSFDLPVTQPRGIAVAEVAGKTWLFVSCFNGGNQRILRINPVTGDVNQEYDCPAQNPRNLTYGPVEPKRLWHVDGQSRRLYALNSSNCQPYASFGTNYFSTCPQVCNVQFLWDPRGLAWQPAANEELAGYLYYLEGGGEYPHLYKLKITPSYDLQSGLELEIIGESVYVPISSAAAIDFYDGHLWVVDVNSHEIVEVDPETGSLTGRKITGFPGAKPAGLEIQQ